MKKRDDVYRNPLDMKNWNSVARQKCIREFGGNPTEYLKSIGYAV